jgi:defect-in-organelle-trafficking protein DotA
MSALTWGMAMYSVILSMMMTMGALMAYYFPMIPYLVFTFAFIQWLVLTIEAMAAAPMLSLGILNPEGEHEVFGKSSMGIAILASVFLRPPLMIIGYFAATVMSYVTVMIVNGGFFFAANSLLGGLSSDGGAASMFGTLIIWGMYVNTLMVVLNKSFTLIYHLADHVTRWIGINEAHGSDIEGMMGKVEGGVKQGAESAKAAGDAQAQARKQSMQAYSGAADQAKDKIKAGAKGAKEGFNKLKGMLGN